MVKGIISILINDDDVQELIGLNALGDTYKVYPVVATQAESLPMATVWQTGRVPEFCKGSVPTTFNYTYEVNIYANDYDQISDIASAMISAVIQADVSNPVNGVKFTDKIRNTDSKDGGYVEQYKAYNRILFFEVPVNESQIT